MKRFAKVLIVGNLLLLLLYVGYYVWQKERILEEGQLLLLELAPVDPRSLLQGDYMRLSYAVGSGLNWDSIPPRGYLILELDDQGIGTRKRLQTTPEPLGEGEYSISYRMPNRWQFQIGAEDYFFQEGAGERFAEAEYGGLRIDGNGNSLLVGLYDEERRLIE